MRLRILALCAVVFALLAPSSLASSTPANETVAVSLPPSSPPLANESVSSPSVQSPIPTRPLAPVPPSAPPTDTNAPTQPPTVATHTQPRGPPSYDLTHSPATSRPDNLPPMVPNPPPFGPVEPTATPPKIESKDSPPSPPTNFSGTFSGDSTASPSEDPDHPLIHLTPPPTGGWRASDLRKREERHAEEAQKDKKKSSGGTSFAERSGAASSSSSSPASNSYISPHGPSEEFRRNASMWYAPPDLHGPMPRVNAATYRPAAAPQYWSPDEAHVAMLEARHQLLRNRRVHTHGPGARTTRLADAGRSRLVEVRENMLYVGGEPFWIQGICYSPVPIGESVSFTPKGDYFTPDYAYIWQRDLPLIKAMGATTLRIYGWAANADHTAFLDAVHEAGLKVLVTYYLGDATQNPVSTVDQRNQILIDFVAQVHRYADHPAVLMWSFGNELNGAWNGFAKQFSDAFGCWWQAGCAGYSDTNSDCQWQSTCMYHQLFSWINAACRAAKIVTTRPIISGFADVDYMVGPTPWLDKVARFNYALVDMDAWAVQLYRGYSFGGYFGMYRGESSKPMIVTEFGVDAYNDACGWPERNQGGCFNMVGEAAGGADDTGHFWGCADGGECAKPGVQAQAEWDVRLANELMAQYVDRGGIVWGGFLMAWTDEYWKGGGTQDLCAAPCKTWDEAWCRGAGIDAYRPGGSAMCSWRAHFTCPNFDTNYHDLCGYFLAAAPDNYVNEEWFGITAPIDCGVHKVNPDGVDGGYRLDSLYVRPAYLQVMQLWSGMQEVDTTHATCDALHACWACSTTHSIDDLNDGACTRECAVPRLAVGPGSSVPRTPHTIGSTLLHGGGTPDSFWSKFGLPIAIGVGVILLATIASVVLWQQRRAAKLQASQQPLLRQELRS